MPSDPLAAGANYGSRQTGSFVAAQRSGSHIAVIPAAQTLPLTAALSGDELFPAFPALEEPQQKLDSTEVATDVPLNAAERIRRRLGQTGQLPAAASVTGRETGAGAAGEERPRTAAIPPGLDPGSVLRVEADQLAVPPAPAPVRSTATLLRKYARRTEPQPPSSGATADATPGAPADLDALLAAYLGDKKP
jgi:hypothetical protein